MSQPVRRPASDDPAARPRPLGARLKLLFQLLIIPCLAVTLPTLAVTGIFGQRPKPKAKPAAQARPTPTPVPIAIRFTPAPAPTAVRPAATPPPPASSRTSWLPSFLRRKATPAPAPDTSALTAALNHSAESLLPTPAPLTPDTVQVRVRADHVAARAEKVAAQAKALDGATVEGVSNPGEKHLYVDLPAGRADAFRRAVADNAPPAIPAAAPAPGAARDQVEVLIRPVADDE